jgi:undecaprenol kinase
MSHAIYKVLKSFTYAIEGIISGFQERNMRVHGIALVVVVALGLWLGLSAYEWLWIILMIGLVLAAELLNTAVEEVCNSMRDELGLPYKSSKRARDVAAGAVLVLAMVAVVVAVVILGPKVALQVN